MRISFTRDDLNEAAGILIDRSRSDGVLQLGVMLKLFGGAWDNAVQINRPAAPVKRRAA